MNTQDTFDAEGICANLVMVTGYEWNFTHDPRRPALDVFETTLPDPDTARAFQEKLEGLGIHFSRVPANTFNEPALTFTLRPEEAQKFITSHELSTITGIKWRISEDSQSYQMAPVDMHKIQVLDKCLVSLGIRYQIDADDNGFAVKLSPEKVATFINSPEQTAGLANELANAARPVNARGV